MIHPWSSSGSSRTKLREGTKSESPIRNRDLNLVVPTLLFYEVMNALRFSGIFNVTELSVAARSLSKYGFGIWRPCGKLLELSAELSVKGDVTLYDACYVALAQRIRSKVITEDKELLRKFPEYATAISGFDEVWG